MKIGEFVKERRKLIKLSINRLSTSSGVSTAHISRIERGLREPSPDILKKLAPALKVSYEDMLRIAGYIYGNAQEKINSYIAEDTGRCKLDLTGLDDDDIEYLNNIVSAMREKRRKNK